MNFKILYFDDQINSIDSVKELLEGDFLITGCTNSSAYDEALQIHRPHGILLDLHMPILDGIELYNKIKESDHYNGCPIFFISGDISDDSRLKMIKSGGVDVFNRQIKANEFKVRLTNKIKQFLQGHTVIDIGNLSLDTHLFTLSLNHKSVDLTLIEMRILSVVMREIPKPISKTELMELIWGDAQIQGKLSVHLSNIKSKLQDWTHEIKIRGNLISVNEI